MPRRTPISTNEEVSFAFVIRLSRDQAGGPWRILLKPIDGGKARLFGDLEAALIYLETVMQNEASTRLSSAGTTARQKFS